MSPSLSIIIPAYNEEKYIGSCLEHILKNAGPEVCEIIVIDNASTDNTKSLAESYGVKVITEARQGVSFARQRGYIESTGEILCFLDADTHMPPLWTDKILKFFAKDKKITFVT